MGSIRRAAGTVLVATVFGYPNVATAAAYTLLGWNTVGMHCIDSDYSVFSQSPPYNTIHAQLIDAQGRLVRAPAGITVTYEAVADPDGLIDTTSAGKTNFWDHAPALFGIALPIDTGLTGASMPGKANHPQPMAFDAAAAWFTADGIPITPYADSNQKSPYPLMRLVARDSLGSELARTDIVLPVSDEMDCTGCHASGSDAAAQPDGGWVNDADPQRDTRLNILRLHDEREAGTDAFRNALAAAGYDAAGLSATATSSGLPILCVRCHVSAAVSGSGLAGIEPLTLAVHRRMAGVVDPATGLVLNSIENRSACVRCHPGSMARGAMTEAVAADGSRAIQCQSCHGSMLDVAAATRVGWIDEPACQSCHTGPATHNNGEIRYLSAFDESGQPRLAVDPTFATPVDTVTAKSILYQLADGHGGLACAACHGSPHAEFPSSQRNDNLQNTAIQGHVGMLVECASCHASAPMTTVGGPHGMHPVGQEWVNRHPDIVGEGGESGGSNAMQCQACHGVDYRGTVLSRVQDDRTLNAGELGSKHLWRGFQVGCYTCHLGPGNSDRNPNRPAVVSDVSASTTQSTPVIIPLNATDPDGNALTLRVVSQPSHGTAGADGMTAQYVPDAGFTGTDSFTFAAWDGSTDSNLGVVTVTINRAPVATPTATAAPSTATATGAPTATPSGSVPIRCAGDCNGRGAVSVADLVTGVQIALDGLPLSHCAAFDVNGDGRVTINELITAVAAALSGCSMHSTPTVAPTSVGTSNGASPTPSVPTMSPPPTVAGTPTITPTHSSLATLANIQATIFTTTCTDATCHSAQLAQGGLVLEAGMSYAGLVNVPAANLTAQRAGLLRVKPGDPDHSFLLIKLTGPPAGEGSLMPLGKPSLSAAQIQLIRDWISAGSPN